MRLIHAHASTLLALAAAVAARHDAASAAFTSSVAAAMRSNATLLEYVYPQAATIARTGGGEVREHWVPKTKGCRIANDCYCFHVEGDMSRSVNPDGWRRCLTNGPVRACAPNEIKPRCNCLHGDSCLFSDMRPTKILAVIAAARLAGVTHIVEEGRFGGLSALMYSLHGFRVTSLELLPLTSVTQSLARRAPSIEMLTGDGAEVLPRLLSSLSQEAAERTMVIFDGQKRLGAYQTYLPLHSHVALAVFDDTNVGQDKRQFVEALVSHNATFFDTRDPAFEAMLRREKDALAMLAPLKREGGAQNWWGGVHMLDHYHFIIAQGGAWRGGGDAAAGSGAATVRPATVRPGGARRGGAGGIGIHG